MCEHKNFQGNFKVARLTENESPGAKVNGYMADITIVCLECRQPFEFIGVPQGHSPFQPMLSADNTELRAPIRLAKNPGKKPSIPFG